MTHASPSKRCQTIYRFSDGTGRPAPDAPPPQRRITTGYTSRKRFQPHATRNCPGRGAEPSGTQQHLKVASVSSGRLRSRRPFAFRRQPRSYRLGPALQQCPGLSATRTEREAVHGPELRENPETTQNRNDRSSHRLDERRNGPDADAPHKPSIMATPLTELPSRRKRPSPRRRAGPQARGAPALSSGGSGRRACPEP